MSQLPEDLPADLSDEALAEEETREPPLRTALVQAALEFIEGEVHGPTWRAFWKVAVEGRTPAEVAAELGMTPGAVRVAKCRVLARLRAELGDANFSPVDDK
jgi:RNA polymerase sigma-70 factor (ECF subfamily)